MGILPHRASPPLHHFSFLPLLCWRSFFFPSSINAVLELGAIVELSPNSERDKEFCAIGLLPQVLHHQWNHKIGASGMNVQAMVPGLNFGRRCPPVPQDHKVTISGDGGEP